MQPWDGVARLRNGTSHKCVRQAEGWINMVFRTQGSSSLTLHPLISDVWLELTQKGADTYERPLY